MSQDIEASGATAGNEGTGATGTGHEGTGDTGAAKGESGRAQARIETLSKKVEQLTAQLDKYQTAEEEREQKAAVERGEHEKVIEDLQRKLQAVQPKAERWDTYHATKREKLLNDLSDDDRALAERLPQDDLGALEAFVARIKPENKPGTTTAKPGASEAPVGPLTPEQIREGVRKHGLDFMTNRGRV